MKANFNSRNQNFNQKYINKEQNIKKNLYFNNTFISIKNIFYN